MSTGAQQNCLPGRVCECVRSHQWVSLPFKEGLVASRGRPRAQAQKTAPGLLALEVLFRSTLTMSVPKGLVRRDLELRGDGRTSASDGEDRQSMKTRTVVTEMAARRSPQKANLGSLDQSTSQAYTLCTHSPSCRITVRS